MNKYQKALKRIRNDYLNGHNPDCDTLQELVDRATPMKPFKREKLMVDYIIGTCPTCGCGVDNNLIKLDDDDKITFCINCGQPIDWSNDQCT